MTRIDSEVRGPGLISMAARLEYRALAPGQPLILQREPQNQVDKNAIVALTVMLQPCGYVARQEAAIVAPSLDLGVLWLCKVTAKGYAFQSPKIVLWRERGAMKKFKELAMAYGADERTADAVLQKKFVAPRLSEEERMMRAFRRSLEEMPNPPVDGDKRRGAMLEAFRWGWERGLNFS
jgi:hypothetical protein